MLKSNKAITLIALIITIIILLILAGVTINMVLGENGLFNKAKRTGEEYKKTSASEIIELKIAEANMQTYADFGRGATLQELADALCDDDEIEYVLKESKKIASLTKIDVSDTSTIYTKLKEYTYEFEIGENRIISIDGQFVDETNRTSSAFARIIFNANGGTGNINPLVVMKNKQVQLPTTGFEKTMCELSGWNTKADGTGDAYSTTISVEGDTTLYAQYSLKQSEIEELNNDEIDELLDNKEKYMSTILNDENAVKTLANNQYAKNKIKNDSEWMSALENCEHAYEAWECPHVTSNTHTLPDGSKIYITASGSGYGFDYFYAMDGKYNCGDTCYWFANDSNGYWQVVFPYKIRIKRIDFYNQNSTSAYNRTLGTARLYTDSTKTKPIGNSFSASDNWQRVQISGIVENEILTNTIFFQRGGSGLAGIGEIIIYADKFLF